MKPFRLNAIQTILVVLFVAIYTSSWWAAGLFGHEKPASTLWAIPAIMSVAAVVAFVSFCVANWEQ